jgi:DNA-binding NarL/FixJ family response regulator
MTHLLFNKNTFSSNDFFEVTSLPPVNFEDDLDMRIHDYLILNRSRVIHSITLPLSITENYFEFSGLYFAYHVRLSRGISFSNVPIILYGSLNLEKVLRATPLAKILFSSRVRYVNIGVTPFDEIIDEIKSAELEPFSWDNFINAVQLHPPANYDSRHSIENEFAIVQWSRIVQCYELLDLRFRREFDSRLYFKFLRSKSNEINYIPTNSDLNSSIHPHAKVMLIDDEAEKGWRVFFEQILKLSPENLKCVNFNLRELNSQEKLIEHCLNELLKFQPNVVLVDLRLSDSDFEEESNIESFTGIKLIEKIRAVDRGVQVLLFTSSNKVWNLSLGLQKGAYDYILKDGGLGAAQRISKMLDSIKICAKRSLFLKKVYKKISTIENLVKSNPHISSDILAIAEDTDVTENPKLEKIQSSLTIAFELLEMCCEVEDKDQYYSYSYLQIFLVIETFVTIADKNDAYSVIYKEGGSFYIRCRSNSLCFCVEEESGISTKLKWQFGKYSIDNNPITINSRMDINFLVSALMIYKFGTNNSSGLNWTSIYTTRNRIAHESYVATKDDVLKILDFVTYVLDNSNESDRNIDKVIKPKSLETMISELQRKYSK